MLQLHGGVEIHFDWYEIIGTLGAASYLLAIHFNLGSIIKGQR
jgi:hypothetical protein